MYQLRPVYYITGLIGNKPEKHLSVPRPTQASDCSALAGHLLAWPLEADEVDIFGTSRNHWRWGCTRVIVTLHRLGDLLPHSSFPSMVGEVDSILLVQVLWVGSSAEEVEDGSPAPSLLRGQSCGPPTQGLQPVRKRCSSGRYRRAQSPVNNRAGFPSPLGGAQAVQSRAAKGPSVDGGNPPARMASDRAPEAGTEFGTSLCLPFPLSSTP